MHLFGTLGTALLIFGSVVEIYLLALKILGESIGGRPLFFVGIVMILAGIQLITTGFLAEMLTRTHLAASQRRSYRIRKIHRVDTNV
jgi:hypothetical protein